MKKKTLKMLAGIAAVVILIGLGWFANACVGNPVSKMLATNTAEKHLAETYPGTDYYIERVSYSFKDSKYHAFIKSPSSIDTEFSLSITLGGELRLDTYEDVQTGVNTARRIEQEYRDLTEAVFTSPTFPYASHIEYGTLEIYPGKMIGNPEYDDVPLYSLNQDELVLDKIYDIRELGRQAGHLVIYIESDTVTTEAAAEIMLDIKARFDDAGIPFAAMDFTLWYPKPTEGKRIEGEVSVAQFPYDDIYADGMIDRVKAADKALREYYAEQDAKK